MLLERLEALRRQPVHVRNRYAFLSALTVTLCIAIMWSISLPSRLSTIAAPIASDPDAVSDRFSEVRTTAGSIAGETGALLEGMFVEETPTTTVQSERPAREILIEGRPSASSTGTE